MEILYRFGREVGDALNKNGVKPPDKGYISAVVVMVADGKNPPLAGSYNYEDGKWVWQDQLEQATRLEEL